MQPHCHRAGRGQAFQRFLDQTFDAEFAGLQYAVRQLRSDRHGQLDGGLLQFGQGLPAALLQFLERLAQR